MTRSQIEEFKKQFKLTATGDYTDVGKKDIKREMLAQYIRKSGDENFEMIGYKQEGTTTAANYEENTVTDVTGTTYNDKTSKAETIEMSEYIVNPKKTAFLEEAIKLKIFDLEDEMTDYEVLTVYGYYRNEQNHCLATLETDCTVTLDNNGGSGFVHSDVNISLSGNKEYGTVEEIVKNPTFTTHTPS